MQYKSLEKSSVSMPRAIAVKAPVTAPSTQQNERYGEKTRRPIRMRMQGVNVGTSKMMPGDFRME